MIYAGALYLLGILFFVNSWFYIWRYKNPQGILLGFIMVGFSLMSVYSGLFISEELLLFPFLFGVDILLVGFIAILFILLFQSLLDSNFVWKHAYWWWFLYPVTQVFLFTFHLTLSKMEQVTIVQNAINNVNKVYFVNLTSYYLHSALIIFIHIYLISYIYYKFRWENVPKKSKTKVVITLSTVLMYGVFSFYFGIKFLFGTGSVLTTNPFSSLIYNLGTFIFFLYFQLWPYYYKHGAVYFNTKTFKIEKYFNTILSKSEINKIDKDLIKLIKIEKIYQDDMLNAASMAKSLGITIHQLSAFLNQNKGQSFYNFINSKRVEEAKKMLKNGSEMNILGICYEVGFNTTSTFYKAFKNETGLSPKDWQKRNS